MQPTKIIAVLLCLAGGKIFSEAAPSFSSSSEIVTVSITMLHLYPSSKESFQNTMFWSLNKFFE